MLKEMAAVEEVVHVRGGAGRRGHELEERCIDENNN